jgi:non-specific serine/threonine protein kinase
MFENAVAQDPVRIAHAAIANAPSTLHLRARAELDERQDTSRRADALLPDLPEVRVARAWIHYTEGKYEESIALVRRAIEQKPDSEGAYYLLCRTLFAAGKYQEVADIAEAAMKAGGEDYNVYVPIYNALGALGKKDAATTSARCAVLEAHLRKVPEDARARTILAADYSSRGARRTRCARPTWLCALTQRGHRLYNVACIFCILKRLDDAMGALQKAWNAGFKDPVWVRRIRISPPSTATGLRTALSARGRNPAGAPARSGRVLHAAAVGFGLGGPAFPAFSSSRTVRT